MGDILLYGISEDGRRIRATPKATSICPSCGELLIPKCGRIKIHHWAHKTTTQDCEYKPETEWHRIWKTYALSQGCDVEVRLGSNIADIFIPSENRVIELQHSTITGDEILQRCENYKIELSRRIDNSNIRRPKIDWMFNLQIKWLANEYEPCCDPETGEQQWFCSKSQLSIFKKDGADLYTINEKWRRRTIELLFNDNGYPAYGRVLIDYIPNEPLFQYMRMFEFRRGYGKLIAIKEVTDHGEPIRS